MHFLFVQSLRNFPLLFSSWENKAALSTLLCHALFPCAIPPDPEKLAGGLCQIVFHHLKHGDGIITYYL